MEDYWYYVIAFVIVIAFIYIAGIINKRQTGSVNGIPENNRSINSSGDNQRGYQSYQDIMDQLNNAAAYSDGTLIDYKYYKSVTNNSV